MQKYLELSRQLINAEIKVSDFETLFLKIRREDDHLMTGKMDKTLERILDTLYLDVSDYTPEELYEANQIAQITEFELLERVKIAVIKLEKLMNS